MTLEEVVTRLRQVHRDRPQLGLDRLARAIEEHIAANQLDLFPEAIVDRLLTPQEREVWLERIVAIYPKRDRIKFAREALADLQPTETVMKEIWAALQWQVAQRDWMKGGGGYAPCLDRYIRGRRWTDRPRRLGRLNDSTIDMMDSMMEFISEEAPCETPPKTARALPPRSGKSRS